MKHSHRISWSGLGRRLRRQFLTGILTVVPLSITIWVLVWFFNAVDGYLQPVIKPILGRPVPGVGFAVTVVLIYLVGVIASNVLGKRLISYGETLVGKVPLVRPLYTGVKQLMDSFSAPGRNGFIQTVLVEFPREGTWTIGFITNESLTQSGESQLSVFVPTVPNPMTGFLQIVSEDRVIRTDIPVDEAAKMIISAGKISPREISERLSGRMGTKGVV
ncbi:MAG: DUF502 domain-containing protein [Chloroflexi bacterium]|nr:DUF502 domain-containing protein [Chloroflexota bacterium]